MQVNIEGNVSAQHQAGETVTLTVTKPDSSTDVFTTVTLADKTYTTQRTYNLAGNYSVVAHVDADGEYVEKDSAPFPFTLTLQDRTITVSASVA